MKLQLQEFNTDGFEGHRRGSGASWSAGNSSAAVQSFTGPTQERPRAETLKVQSVSFLEDKQDFRRY